MNKTLSVIIPAYNESERITRTLGDIFSYNLETSDLIEVIVVSDGSTDSTVNVVNHYQQSFPILKIIEYFPNEGKGFAVKTGMLNAVGDLVLFCDADGSTPFIEIEKLLQQIDTYDIVIGSRAHKNSHVETTLKRFLIGRIFSFLLSTFLISGFKDTQCGFKLFNKHVVKELFSRQKAKKFSFDYEILFLAKKLNLSVKEVGISWQNIDGSKVNLVSDSLKMLKDIFLIRFWH